MGEKEIRKIKFFLREFSSLLYHKKDLAKRWEKLQQTHTQNTTKRSSLKISNDGKIIGLLIPQIKKENKI